MMRCRSVLASRSPPSCRTKSAQRGSQCPQDSTAFTWRNSRTAIGISVSNQPTRTLRAWGPGMLKMSPTGRRFSEAASRRDLVQFYAQYRTEHDVPAPVSGVVQLIPGTLTPIPSKSRSGWPEIIAESFLRIEPRPSPNQPESESLVAIKSARWRRRWRWLSLWAAGRPQRWPDDHSGEEMSACGLAATVPEAQRSRISRE